MAFKRCCDRCGSSFNVTPLEEEDLCKLCIEGDRFTFLATYNPTPEEEWNESLSDRYDDFMREI